jgi:uncharacterized membrane protein
MMLEKFRSSINDESKYNFIKQSKIYMKSSQFEAFVFELASRWWNGGVNIPGRHLLLFCDYFQLFQYAALSTMIRNNTVVFEQWLYEGFIIEHHIESCFGFETSSYQACMRVGLL